MWLNYRFNNCHGLISCSKLHQNWKIFYRTHSNPANILYLIHRNIIFLIHVKSKAKYNFWKSKCYPLLIFPKYQLIEYGSGQKNPHGLSQFFAKYYRNLKIKSAMTRFDSIRKCPRILNYIYNYFTV